MNAHLAMYLIWRMDTTAKGAKKNTSLNVHPFTVTWFEIVKNSLKSLGELYKNNTWEILQSIEIL